MSAASEFVPLFAPSWAAGLRDTARHRNLTRAAESEDVDGLVCFIEA